MGSSTGRTSCCHTGGQAGFILPAYAFQTASRVVGYAERWALSQSMIPRNLFPGLSLPLVFATFEKGRRRTMIGFALYRETAAVHKCQLQLNQRLSS
ncbi:hypothetical protein ACWV27_26135 (plasmid) [Massilia varians]